LSVAWYDAFTRAFESTDQLERDRLAQLGQDPNDPRLQGITFESPTSPIDKSERDLFFPKGVPDQTHSGGLASLARSSMAPPPEAQQLNAERKSPAAPSPGNRAESPKFLVNDPSSMAHLDQAERETRAYGDIGFSVGTLIRLAASMGAGGAAAGAGAGAGAGAAGGAAGGAAAGEAAGAGAGYTGAAGFSGAASSPGTAAGASSGAGFGGGGGGFGGYLQRYGGKFGQAYNEYQAGNYGKAVMDAYQGAQDSGLLGGKSGGGSPGGGGSGYLLEGEAPHGQAGGGGDQFHAGAIGNELSWTFGAGKDRRANLAKLGLLPQFAPQMASSEGGYWDTTG
jgi:hypothetical protein